MYNTSMTNDFFYTHTLICAHVHVHVQASAHTHVCVFMYVFCIFLTCMSLQQKFIILSFI